MATKTGYVYRAALSKDDLLALIAPLFKKNDASIVRRVNGADFPPFHAEEAAQWLGEWDKVQFFNEQVELRWRRIGGRYSVLLLSEQSKELLLAEQGELPTKLQSVHGAPFIVVNPSSDNGHGFLLWGTRLDEDQWWETRIPRPLRYPRFPKGSNTKPPQLAYRLYRDNETVRWVRLLNLVEVK